LKSIQPWDYIAANDIGYFEGNIIKYISRWKNKGGLDDLRKAQHYLEKLIELNTVEKNRDQHIGMERLYGHREIED
jgi:hypothetical protein